jgi:hypothetical protein
MAYDSDLTSYFIVFGMPLLEGFIRFLLSDDMGSNRCSQHQSMASFFFVYFVSHHIPWHQYLCISRVITFLPLSTILPISHLSCSNPTSLFFFHVCVNIAHFRSTKYFCYNILGAFLCSHWGDTFLNFTLC